MYEASLEAMKTIASASSFREAEAAHRNSRRQSSLVFLCPRESGQHAGVRRARSHRIHPNSRFGDLGRNRLRDAFDGMLAADIDRGTSRTLVPVGR